MIRLRYDFSWQRAHVVALGVVLAVGGVWLALRWTDRPIRLGRSLPVIPQRVAAAQEKINPNIASVGSLRRLSGVGPVRAQAIADYAAAQRGTAFRRAEDLTAIDSIGPGTVERIRPHLTFPPDDN